MQVSTIAAAPSTASAGQNRNTAKVLGKDDFLRLLVTQIRYQDPLKPTEDKEFIAQLAQFSSLEQMQNLNASFESLANLQKNLYLANATSQAVSLIGRQVEGTEDNSNFSGVVNGMKIADGVPKILIDGREYNLSSIRRVTMPPVVPSQEVTAS